MRRDLQSQSWKEEATVYSISNKKNSATQMGTVLILIQRALDVDCTAVSNKRQRAGLINDVIRTRMALSCAHVDSNAIKIITRRSSIRALSRPLAHLHLFCLTDNTIHTTTSPPTDMTTCVATSRPYTESKENKHYNCGDNESND
jgi:hypothetical protein